MYQSLITDNTYPLKGTIADRLTYLLRHAVHAPSPQNTQPWLFEVRGEGVDIYLDRSRALPVGDPDGREMVISVGAVLDHLEVAMRAHGMVPAIRYTPDRNHSDLVARIECIDLQCPIRQDLDLLPLIAQRHSVDKFREDSYVSAGVLSDLALASNEYHCGIRWVDPGPLRTSLGTLLKEADEALFSGKRFRSEISHWLRTNGNEAEDGVPVEALGVARAIQPLIPWLVEHVDFGTHEGKEDYIRVVTAPALGILFTDGDHTADWLNAGRALSRILLRAAQMGYHCALFDQPMDSERLRLRIRGLLNTNSDPQAIIRIGVAAATPAVHTSRRPVESFFRRPGRPQYAL